MLSSVEVFDLIKQRHNLPSDGALARLLDVTPGLISKHRHRPFGMDNMLALKCAELLQFDPALLLIWASAERAKCTPEAAAWNRLAVWAEMRKNELQEGFAPPGAPRWDGKERRR